jgi:hypothetical protein
MGGGGSFEVGLVGGLGHWGHALKACGMLISSTLLLLCSCEASVFLPHVLLSQCAASPQAQSNGAH